MVKNLPAIQETQVQFLGQEDPLEKEKATHSIILAWRFPWTEQCGVVHYSLWGHEEPDIIEATINSKITPFSHEKLVWYPIHSPDLSALSIYFFSFISSIFLSSIFPSQWVCNRGCI